MPKVSVIIPTFNRANVISRSIDSVLAQRFKDFELIIVDDGSTDQTQKILEQYKNNEKIKVIFQHNQGVSAARNVAIKSANGEWLAFLDSDDEWLPTKLERQFDMISENPDLKVVHTQEQWIRNGKKVNQMKKHQKYGGYIFENCLPLCLMSPSSILIHHQVFSKVGLFREDFPVCEDYDLWLKITAHFEVGFVSDVQINKYGGHDDQLSAKYHSMDYYRVKSMAWVYENCRLSLDQKKLVLQQVESKCEILLKGMRKHNNFTKYQEILDLRQKISS